MSLSEHGTAFYWFTWYIYWFSGRGQFQVLPPAFFPDITVLILLVWESVWENCLLPSVSLPIMLIRNCANDHGVNYKVYLGQDFTMSHLNKEPWWNRFTAVYSMSGGREHFLKFIFIYFDIFWHFNLLSILISLLFILCAFIYTTRSHIWT